MPSAGLVGRGQDLRAIDQALIAGTRLLTVTGAAGVGKSALARELGASWQARDEGDVVWVDLTNTDSGDAAAFAVAGALAVALDERSADERVRQLAHTLSGRGAVLLVLDNADRLAKRGTDMLDVLLERALGAQFLVTSRGPLRHVRETVYRLNPLSTSNETASGISDAGRLWVERTRTRVPGYELPAADAPIVTELVRELDGLPLAIELAAAHAPLLGPADQLRRLSNRFELLQRSYPGGVPHHATLEAALEWSWNLLEPEEQSALAQCSVFRGGFTLDAAENVLRLDGHRPVASVLQSLVDKNLLFTRAVETLPGERRLSLSSSVQEFVERALNGAGLRRAAMEMHELYYVDFAEGLAHFPPASAAARRAELERENLLAVVERCLAPERVELALRALLVLDHFAPQGGDVVAHAPLLDRALEVHERHRAANPLRVRALCARGRLAPARPGPDAGERDFRAAAQLAASLDSPELESAALLLLCQCLSQRGAFDEASEVALRARELSAAVGSVELEVETLAAQSQIARQRGQLVEALTLCDDGLRLASARRLTEAESRLLELLANIQLEAGAPDLAQGFASRAAELAHLSGDTARGHRLDMLLANLDHVSDRLEEASARYSRVLDAARKSRDRRTEAYAAAYWAFAEWERGEQSSAELQLRDAIALLQQSGELRYEMFAKGTLAVMVASTGRFEMAEALLEEAEQRLRRDPLWSVAIELCRGMVELELAWRAARPEERQKWLSSASDRLARARASSSPRASAPVARSAEVRRLSQLLERALCRPDATRERAKARRVLVLDRQGWWFEPFRGRRVDLRRRAPMSRLLLALARSHKKGTVLTAPQLIALAWPGERMLVEAAQNRLYVTLSRLRDLGLRDALQSTPGGYALDPDMEVTIA